MYYPEPVRVKSYTRSAREPVTAFPVLTPSPMLFSADKAIADADHGFDAIAAQPEFLPQAADVHVERARVAEILIAPDVIEQILPGDHAAAAFRQRFEQSKLFSRELYLLALAYDANIGKIDGKLVVVITLDRAL